MSLLRKILPPPQWRIPVVVLLGVLTGISTYSFYVSKAWSYLSDDPATCVNCHVMTPQYATWAHSSHYNQATCNDCHIPHDNLFHTYLFKAKDGMRHATMFTLRLEPQVIRIKEEGRQAVKQNCQRCHGHLVENTKLNPHASMDIERDCWDCHRDTPHGRHSSLSSAPFARVPVPKTMGAQWLKDFLSPSPDSSDNSE